MLTKTHSIARDGRDDADHLFCLLPPYLGYRPATSKSLGVANSVRPNDEETDGHRLTELTGALVADRSREGDVLVNHVRVH